jgi:arabinan endo-1,5-alpha-L-arabinosidase
MKVDPKLVIAAVIWAWLATCGSSSSPSTAPDAALQGDVERVHDPSLIKQGSTYYVFSTDTHQPGHLPIRCSTDLQRWTLCGSVFETIPSWIQQKIPTVRGLWAPDISYFSGKYHVYYAASTFGSNRSIIALATNVTLDRSSPDYAWVDEGMVIESQRADDWNAIDPNIFIADQGRVWMTWGSFWSGIKMRRIDPATGKLSAEDPVMYSLASRPAEKAIEAPFLFRHDGGYYLFVSFDFCCRGAASTYKMMVGRGDQVTGPYTDRSGVSMLNGGATLLLQGSGRWRGPGGQSVYHDGSTDLIVYHAYDASTGKPFLQIARLEWIDGWPRVVSLH